MKNIIEIFKEDIKDTISNKAVLIVVIALAILPSLYAWFNIKASWDPYGNTSNIKVAVVNNDKGTTLLDKKFNMGDKLIDELKANKSLGWQFMNTQEARKGVETGKYYAYIEIPQDFSKDITSVLGKNVHKAKINYTVNEKINAVAPKITDKGASTIQLNVNQTIVKIASEAVFEVMNEIGITLEENLPMLSKIEGSLVEVQGKFDKMDDILNTATDASAQVTDIVKLLQEDMPLIESTLKNSIGLSGDVKNFLSNTQSSMNDIAPTIKNDLQIINTVSSSAIDGMEDLISAIQNGYENAPQLIESIQKKIDNLSSITTTLEEFLTKIDKIMPGTSLGGTIQSIKDINSKLSSIGENLNTIKDQINNGQTPSLDKLNGILTVLKDVNNITGGILNNFDSKITKPLNEIFTKGMSVSGDVITLLEKAEEKLPKVNNILDTALNFTGDADEAIAYIKTKMPEAKEALDKLVNAMSAVNNSEEMNDLVKFLRNDIVKHSNFLEEPVEVESKSLYPIANYGSAMTPFYTVLSLWVGVLLLTSLLSTEVHGKYKPYEVYFGRGLTFLSIALIQGLIVSSGDILLLGVKATNPVLFVVLSVFISMVFTFIVYSLVSVLGNIGKSIAVVLLVIQVAGSGGTFPIQVTPRFFQVVNPFLPFTYGIGALRETIGGIYKPNLMIDIVILIIFLVLSIVLNVILKGPMNRVLSKFTDRFAEGRISEH